MKRVFIIIALLFMVFTISSHEWEFLEYIDINGEEKMLGRLDVLIQVDGYEQYDYITFKMTPLDMDIYMEFEFDENDEVSLDFINDKAQISSIPLFVFDNIATLKKDYKRNVFDIFSHKSQYHVLFKLNSEVIFEFDFHTKDFISKFGMIYAAGVPVHFL